MSTDELQTHPGTLSASIRGRVIDTFIAPSRLVARLRRMAPWLDVLLISTAVALLSVALMPDEIFTDAMRDPVTRRGEPVELTSSPDAVARWGRGMGMLATIATHPLIAFTLAGLLTLLFSVLGRGRAGFREYLALSAHAMLIPALGTVIAIAIRLVAGAATGALGMTAFLDPADAPNLLMAAIYSIDPFIVWMMATLAIGVHALEPKYSKLVPAVILIGGYLMLVLGSTALLHPELRGAEQTEDVQSL